MPSRFETPQHRHESRVADRLVELLAGEFEGFNLSDYPADTYREIMSGFLDKYWLFGWMHAWNWAANESAKIVRDSHCPAMDPTPPYQRAMETIRSFQSSLN